MLYWWLFGDNAYAERTISSWAPCAIKKIHIVSLYKWL